MEATAAVLFLGIAAPLAATALGSHPVKPELTLMLIGLYALVVGSVRFPLGVGYVVPSYVMLVPMLLLLPPLTVPLFTAAGLVLASTVRWATRRDSAKHVLFSVPNASHALGPAIILALAGSPHGGLTARGVFVYLLAFAAACLVDVISSTVREAAGLRVTPQVQLRVAARAWMIDACVAPLGFVFARAARSDHLMLLGVVPFAALLLILDRDRTARIAQAQHRLALVGRERARLQTAVQRLGDAFAAKLDLPAITRILLRGSVEALDAEAGQLTFNASDRAPTVDTTGEDGLVPLLRVAVDMSSRSRHAEQLERDGIWVLALPFGSADEDSAQPRGALAVARHGRRFEADEEALMLGLSERAHGAAREILAHEALREQAVTDPLTRLGNRRKLAHDLTEWLANALSPTGDPLVLLLFDLDGFKSYNDTFGHSAGDLLLTRLAGKLAAAVLPHGAAYRLGGDEFCALLPARAGEFEEIVARAAAALCEEGETFSIGASCGAVLLPQEASTPDYALQLADERMYAHKKTRPSAAFDQTRDVLIRVMHAKQPGLREHGTDVAELAVPVGRRLGMTAEQLDELARAAELHDIGKVGIPDGILEKAGPLDENEWQFMRQHTILGARILSAAPALRPVAMIVRASHERWDGRGYPDGLRGEAIPLGARIVAVCDAYDAIISRRCYRPARSPELARQELLREAGRQFDPAVVEVFLSELAAPSGATGSAAQHEGARQLALQIAERFRPMLPGNGLACSTSSPGDQVALSR